MSYTNAYKAPESATVPEGELHGPDPYDINFVYPLPEHLETPRVKLTPFIPSVHGQLFWDGAAPHPGLLPGTWPSYAAFLSFVESDVRRDPSKLLLAILDKSRPDPALGGGALAGLVALYDACAVHQSAEIAFLVVLPPFQGARVARGAVGALLRACLALPPAGLGLRRVQYTTHARNAASCRVAAATGFRSEGRLHWYRLLPRGAAFGEQARPGDRLEEYPGRHLMMWSVCWDDWEGGVKDVVAKIIEGEA